MNILQQYKLNIQNHTAFTEKLKILLKSLLDAQKTKYQLIEARTKSIESLADKVKLKGAKYNNSLCEIKDLSAIRIIAYYQKDIETINKLIRDNFLIDTDNTVIKSESMNSNEFGYLSNHYIIQVDSPRINLPEWAPYKKLNAEIQVRTVLQHSWAAISHELQYKSELEIPSTLKRRLYRLAGLFELADEEFGAVKEKQSELSRAIKGKKEISDKKVYNELNFETLSNLLKTKNKLIQFYANQAKKAGFLFDMPGDFTETKSSYNKQYTEIMLLLNFLSIKSIPELIKFLNSNKDQARKYYKLQFDASIKIKKPDESTEWYASNEFIIILFLMNFLPNDKLEYKNLKGWSNQIYKRVTDTILAERTKK